MRFEPLRIYIIRGRILRQAEEKKMNNGEKK
jgi:hypothetical protein